MMNLFEEAKQELARSNADRKHPFRFFTLGSYNSDQNFPELRTVVKRGIKDDFSIYFFTDSRSPKVEQLKKHPNVSVLFYHSKKQLQIRIRAKAELIGTDSIFYHEQLERAKQAPSVSDYQSLLSPSSPLSSDLKFGEKLHFSLILLHASELDILQLDRAEHQRFLYQKKGDKWIKTRLVP
ncbi:pyridoxamine 5'-phosphate oxidase family protein [Sediminitomix flava]|uniref:Pyridoxine/pyridoxamine 5'-phosphate oxidase n=1 Tax=Sediminitomix flava TaxID=379075 RepID=A0A315Z7K5_SEDFL|nr:pyridoxamine 5'-phosphate oxidase family protein [Sediminitomix flava]PWJ40837.1 pyridoxine/pyridoxamine 5'-phosphate oxidase [Sediminitomix flava]